MRGDPRRQFRTKITNLLNRMEAQSGDAFYRTADDTWVVNLGNTRTHIKIAPSATDPSSEDWTPRWASFATELFDKVVGSLEAENRFLWTIFEWNTAMNGTKIGFEANKLTLNSEYEIASLDLEMIIDALLLHYKRHSEYFEKVLNLAVELGLHTEPPL